MMPDGLHHQVVDYVLENRKLTRSLSMSDILYHRGDASREWAGKVLQVQGRLAEQERERERTKSSVIASACF